ncbi:diaminopimelate epimerase, partial [bacterium]|nr:diaminopimelate epimerase [bacterium]
GIGADGLVVLTKSEQYHAKWIFYNSDGSEAEMCGNAARCAIRYLAENYFPNDVPICIETKIGVIKGQMKGPSLVEVTLTPKSYTRFEYEQKLVATDKYSLDVHLINTGVPHAVIEVKDLDTYPILQVGKDLRSHSAMGPEGANVTFFQRLVGPRIKATTFERGVEGETLACGTGAAAAAIVYSETYLQPLPIEVIVPGGELLVDISPVSKMLLLQGPAAYCFTVTVPEISSGFEKVYPYSQGKRPNL